MLLSLLLRRSWSFSASEKRGSEDIGRKRRARLQVSGACFSPLFFCENFSSHFEENRRGCRLSWGDHEFPWLGNFSSTGSIVCFLLFLFFPFCSLEIASQRNLDLVRFGWWFTKHAFRFASSYVRSGDRSSLSISLTQRYTYVVALYELIRDFLQIRMLVPEFSCLTKCNLGSVFYDLLWLLKASNVSAPSGIWYFFEFIALAHEYLLRAFLERLKILVFVKAMFSSAFFCRMLSHRSVLRNGNSICSGTLRTRFLIFVAFPGLILLLFLLMFFSEIS